VPPVVEAGWKFSQGNFLHLAFDFPDGLCISPPMVFVFFLGGVVFCWVGWVACVPCLSFPPSSTFVAQEQSEDCRLFFPPPSTPFWLIDIACFRGITSCFLILFLILAPSSLALILSSPQPLQVSF